MTDQIGEYRLVFKQGEPFLPVNLRVHNDPLSILAKVLDLNPKSYTRPTDFVHMGLEMVKADLIPREEKETSELSAETIQRLGLIAEKRVISMCIDAALAEDDFETAYSYVVNRLSTTTSELGSIPKDTVDDFTWRAALQAGRYRLNPQANLPTHVGADSSNLIIRHLEHRMQCLGHALRFAPKNTLQEILNVYRRCEEELEVHIKAEEAKEIEWDSRADEGVHGMPGGFAATTHATGVERRNPRAGEEAPVSLFDLSRKSLGRAQSGLSALASFRSKPGRGEGRDKVDTMDRDSTHTSMDASFASLDSMNSFGQDTERIRKRDQLKDAAVGTLASGIGWLINAPAPERDVDH